MKSQALSMAVVFLLAAGLAVGAEFVQASRLVAVAAGRPVTTVDLANRLRLKGIDLAEATQEDWEDALTVEIDRAVLLDAAGRAKIDVSDDDVTRTVAERRTGPRAGEYVRQVELLGLDKRGERDRMREQLLMEGFLVRKLGAKLFVAPKAVAEWYENNKDVLASPEVRVARVLTVRVGLDGDAGSAKEKAEALREKARRGEDFEELAKEHSADPWAANGGLLEPMQRGESGSLFAEPVFAIAEAGEIGPVFETELGFHVLKLEEVRPAVVPTFEEAQEAVREILLDRLRAEHVSKLVDGLRRATTVQIFRDQLPMPEK